MAFASGFPDAPTMTDLVNTEFAYTYGNLARLRALAEFLGYTGELLCEEPEPSLTKVSA
jgi:hypothetical protein